MATIHIRYDDQGDLVSVTRTDTSSFQRLKQAKKILDIVRAGAQALNPVEVAGEQLQLDYALLKVRTSQTLTDEQKQSAREILLTANVITDDVDAQMDAHAPRGSLIQEPGPVPDPRQMHVLGVVDP